MTTKVNQCEVIDMNGSYETDYIRLFYNNHKVFGESFSYKITDEFNKFLETINKDGYNICKNQYIKFKRSENIQCYDENNKKLNTVDFNEKLRENNVKIIFTIKKYNYNGKKGITLKIEQMKFRKIPNKFENNLFTD